MAKTDKTSSIYVDGKQAGQTINNLRKESRRLNNEINQMAPGTDAYKRKVAELGKVKGQLTDHRNEIKKVSGSYKNVRKSMGGVQSMVKGFLGAGAIMGAVRGIVSGIGNWVKTNAQLSASLSSLKSITGASTKDIQFYKKEAIQMGAETTQSATQVVDAMKLIGSAKPELLGNKQALADVTKETITLAEAAEMGMKPAADALTGSLNQWGKGAEEAGRFSNVLAAGSKAGAANIESLSQSIDKSGAVMAGYNVNIEQGVGLLETMAERNIRGAEAGTALRNVLLTMQTIKSLPPDALADMERYGVNVDVVADKNATLKDRLTEMSKVVGDATAMKRIFGKENIVAAAAVLENTENVEKFTEAVTGTNTATEQAAINNDNLQGDLKSLSSAWEGFTLTVGSGEGVLRSLVQTGVSVLNWVSGLWSAIAEGDDLKFEEQMLKLADSMWIFGGSVQDAIDDARRLNRITGEVIDQLETETRSFNVLTNALKDNNKKIDEANEKGEDANEIKEENERIIEALTEKYPDLTAEMDLQSMSNEQLIEWQDKANESMLESILKQAEAAEKKRILNQIIEDSIALSRQEADETIGAWNNVLGFFSGLGGQTFKNIDLANAKQDLKDLSVDYDETGQVIQKVGQDIRNMNLNFAQDFDITTQNIEKQTKKIEELEAEMQKMRDNNKEVPAQVKARYEGMIKALEGFEKEQQGIKDENTVKDYDRDKQAADKRADLRSEEAEKARKLKEKQLEKLRDKLQDLADFEKEVNAQKNRDVLLANKEGLELELQEQKFAIEDKYQAEIESAKELAKEKGKIGAEGAERLATLEALKAEELANLKADIQKRTNDEKEAKEKASLERRSEVEILLEDATWNTKKTLLEMKLSELGETEIEKRREIIDQLTELEKEKAITDFERKKIALSEEFENDKLTKEEQDILMRELETEHQQKLTEIKAEAVNERKALTQQQVTNVINGVQMAVDMVSQLRKAEHEIELNRLEEERTKRIEELDLALRSNEISQEQYDQRVAEIETNAEDRRKELALEEFERNKRTAIINAAIKTAMAVMQALASSPPPASYGLAAAAAVLGGVQIAAIQSQQPPQFAEGGYTTVTGAEDGKKYNAKIHGKAKAGMLPGGPQLVLANEKGPEYFIPNPMLNDPEVIDHVRAIENIRVRQFAEGGATDQIPQEPSDIEGARNSDELMKQMMNYLLSSTKTIEQLRIELKQIRVVLGDEDINAISERQEEIDKMSA